MKCHACGKELAEGAAFCPHCGAELTEAEAGGRARPSWGWADRGRLLEDWPRDGDGQPVAPAFLTHCSSVGFEDEMVAGMLRAYGIPCVKRFPGDGALGRVVLGMSGTGTDIYVPVTMLEEARSILEGESDAQV
jgi:hypothetical protein